jgi:hypothetical protein
LLNNAEKRPIITQWSQLVRIFVRVVIIFIILNFTFPLFSKFKIFKNDSKKINHDLKKACLSIGHMEMSYVRYSNKILVILVRRVK